MEDKIYPAEVGRWLDFLYEQFCDWKSKGGEYAMTCPNCGAEMELDQDTGIWECPECHYSEQRN